jgi:hypothetical protein
MIITGRFEFSSLRRNLSELNCFSWGPSLRSQQAPQLPEFIETSFRPEVSCIVCAGLLPVTQERKEPESQGWSPEACNPRFGGS